jgi:hypothetical protein
VNAVVLADAEHRHDVGVVQFRRRPRLLPEALQVRRAQQAVKRQHLEGDVPAQRLLHRLVDHPHAAPAHLAQDAVLAQLPRRGAVGRAGRDVGAGGRARQGAELFHLDQRREQLADLLGQARVARGVLGQGRSLAAAVALGELLGQHFQRVAARSRLAHAHTSPMPPGMLDRISLSFRRART